MKIIILFFLKYKVQQTEFFFIFGHFLFFHHAGDPEKQNFEKLKKSTCKYYHFTTCTINDNHLIYGFWDMEADKIFCHSGLFFCPFILILTQKIKTLKKMKKMPGDILILHSCITNDNHMMYASWDMDCETIFCHFRLIFCPFSHLWTHKIKILK